jgi:hypothetical protein
MAIISLASLATLTLLNPVGFPPRPMEFHMAKGQSAYVAGKGIDRLWQDDRQAIGFWFDGMRKQDVEEAIWLSPALLSRWVGYRAAQEKWTPEQSQQRWDALRQTMDGRAYIVVRLAAYPKRDILNPEDAEPISTRDLDQVRFMVTVDGAAIPSPKKRSDVPLALPVRSARSGPNFAVDEAPIAGQTIGYVRTGDRGDIARFPWYLALDELQPVWSEFENGLQYYRTRGGSDFAAKWTLIVVDFSGRQMPKSQFELRVLSANKERTATFKTVFEPTGPKGLIGLLKRR